MLLTNTINALTIDTTIALGNVKVCGVASRGCSAVPAPAAREAKPSSRRSKRVGRLFEAVMQRLFTSALASWRYLWRQRQLAPASHSPASKHALGFVSGCSLN